MEDRLGLVNVRDVPPQYRHLAGTEGHLRALESIRALTRDAGIPFVLFAAYGDQFDWSAVEAFIEESGIIRPHFDEVVGLRYQLNVENRHYNVDGHRELARRILVGLVSKASACIHTSAVPQAFALSRLSEPAPSPSVPGVSENSPDTLVPPGRVVLGMDGATNGRFASFGVAGGAGKFSLTVSAAGTPCKDVDGSMYAELVATLDGKPLAAWRLTGDRLTAYKSEPFALTAERQEIQFSLAKDRYLGPECDRSVRVAWAELAE